MAKPVDPALRQRLIEAAGREFASAGFAGANLSRIGSLAGVTKGGVYFHFRSKEELFYAAVEYWRAVLRELVTPRGEVTTLREFLVGYLDFHFRHPEASGLLRVLASEMHGRFTTQVREDHQAALRGVRQRIRELLMQGTHDGSLFTTDPALATFVIAATVEGVLSLVHSSPQDAEPFRHPESVVDFSLAPYETSPDAPTSSPPAPGASEGVDFLPPL